jgi:hypothetical protein
MNGAAGKGRNGRPDRKVFLPSLICLRGNLCAAKQSSAAGARDSEVALFGRETAVFLQPPHNRVLRLCVEFRGSKFG